MILRPLLGLSILLAATLAGCTGNQPASDPAHTATDSDPIAQAGAYTPWTISDFWVYDMDVRGFDRFADTKLVYYEESGPEFVVGTPEHGEALYHAVFSINPILGRVHQHHLSPHERGAHAEMFPFENGIIQDGQVWTTVFYEHQMRMEATYDQSVPTPNGPTPGFLIRGENADGDFRVEFNYVAAVKWFTDLRVVDADGQVFRLQLTETGTGYSGPAHFIRAKDLFHGTLRGSGFTPVERTFHVETGDVNGHRVESLAISTNIELESGFSATLRIIDPDGDTIYERQFDDPADGEYDIRQVWPTGSDTTDQDLGSRPQWPAGPYIIRLTMTGTASADINIVGTQDNSGRV